jgi:hypothetical protein
VLKLPKVSLTVSFLFLCVSYAVKVQHTTAESDPKFQSFYIQGLKKIYIFFEIFAGWMRILDAWIPGKWEFTV